MLMMSNALPGIVGGAFSVLLGVLCLVFNRRVGVWLRRFLLAVFGSREGVTPDEIVFRGLSCLAGLLYAGIGLMLVAELLK